jgi:hypothetical protein
VRLTGIVRQIARATRTGRRRTLSAGVVILAALGTLAGVLAALLSGPPDSGGLASQLSFGLPAVQPSTGDAPVITGAPLTLEAGARPLPDSLVPAVSVADAGRPTVAPLRRTVQADLLIVAPFSLPAGLLAAVSRLPGMVAAERIEAVRMQVNGAETAVVGVDPSQFRSFAARPTGAANALWQGVANGGIAVSYTMGKLDKVPLGGSVLAGGRTAKRLHVVAFGTLGIGGVNAVVSDATARALGAPAGNAIVLSVGTGNFTADSAAIGRLLPKGAGLEPLVSLVNSGAAGAGAAGAGAAGALTAGPESPWPKPSMVCESRPIVAARTLATFFSIVAWYCGTPLASSATCVPIALASVLITPSANITATITDSTRPSHTRRSNSTTGLSKKLSSIASVIGISTSRPT